MRPSIRCWLVLLTSVPASGLAPIPLVVRSAHAQTEAAPTTAGELVLIEAGDLPIILSAPHGGRRSIPGIEPRRGDKARQFTISRDVDTDTLALRVADLLEQKLGRRPYLVVARFHRQFVDANRPPADAYESDHGRDVYTAYHAALADARNDVIRRWGRGLLLDLHGQSAEPRAVLRGTQNGSTVTHLVNESGPEALYGPTSLFGQLAQQGLTVHPAVDSTDREHPSFNGGYIVRTYGSSQGGTLDAIQLEFGRDLRTGANALVTADHLAQALAAFAETYLPRDELHPTTKPARPASTHSFTRRQTGPTPDITSSYNPS